MSAARQLGYSIGLGTYVHTYVRLNTRRIFLPSDPADNRNQLCDGGEAQF